MLEIALKGTGKLKMFYDGKYFQKPLKRQYTHIYIFVMGICYTEFQF